MSRYRIEVGPRARQYAVTKIDQGVEPIAIFYDLERAARYIEWASSMDEAVDKVYSQAQEI